MFSLLLALIYICFISLGLPDSLLGSAWPVLHVDIGAPISHAGIISTIVSALMIVSTLISPKAVKKLGAGAITAASVTLTAVALYGYSTANSFLTLVLWSIPYGLGAGGVDSVLNNYVALHYKPQHMSWLHCFWGVGASISPYIMSFALIKLNSWSRGYLIVSLIQMALSTVIFISLPLWKNNASPADKGSADTESKPLSFREILRVPGAVPCFITFFGYCALEVSASLWASTYLVQNRGIEPEVASGLASFFYIGITLGRAVNGFLAMKLSDRTLIRMGMGIIAIGVLLMFLPFGAASLAGFLIIGIGCAPVYPCIVHMTPDLFGRERSQSMMSFQLAFAYLGFCIVPPLFGLIAEHITISLLPPFLAILLAVMAVMHEIVVKKTGKTEK